VGVAVPVGAVAAKKGKNNLFNYQATYLLGLIL